MHCNEVLGRWSGQGWQLGGQRAALRARTSSAPTDGAGAVCTRPQVCLPDAACRYDGCGSTPDRHRCGRCDCRPWPGCAWCQHDGVARSSRVCPDGCRSVLRCFGAAVECRSAASYPRSTGRSPSRRRTSRVWHRCSTLIGLTRIGPTGAAPCSRKAPGGHPCQWPARLSEKPPRYEGKPPDARLRAVGLRLSGPRWTSWVRRWTSWVRW